MLSCYMTSWKHYMNDTIVYSKIDAIDHVLYILNSFHRNISFTYTQVLLVLLYKGIQGEHMLKHIKCEINKVLPVDKNMQPLMKKLTEV